MGALTVADILSRNAPVPVKILGSQTRPPLSVGKLLRREGRAPADEATTDPTADTAAPRLVMRRGALAAGAVLAAGSAFGFTVLNGTAPVADQQSLGGPYPGQGLLDGAAPAATPVAPVVISPTAASSGLDAGMSAPTAWTPVAFPSGAGGTGGASKKAIRTVGADRTAPSGSTHTPQAPAAGGAATSTPPPTPTGGRSTSNPGTTDPGPTGSSPPAGRSPSAVPGPVASTVNGLGTAVTNTGTAVGGAVDSVVAPAATTVGGLL